MADTNVTISLANGLRFANNNGLRPSFDNTLTSDESFIGIKTNEFCQYFEGKSGVPLQLRAELDATVVVTKIYHDGTRSTETPNETNTYTNFKTIDYIISYSVGDLFYLTVESETSSYTSEWISCEETLTGWQKIEWYGYQPTDTNNDDFIYDYSTTTAQASVPFLFLKANLLPYTPGGDSSVYDNQQEKIKLKQNVFRNLELVSENIPRWLAEKLVIAMAQDVFVVNDVVYTVEELPTVETFGRTNNVTLSAVLTQATILGLNSDDIGFDCDATPTGTEMIDNRIATGETTSGSFAIPSGWNITQVLYYANSGSGTIKVGTSVGGDDIMMSMPLNATGGLVNIRSTPSLASGAWTCYYTVTGTVNFDIRINIIDNTNTI